MNWVCHLGCYNRIIELNLLRQEFMTWKPYNPTWLVELAREQYPKKVWLVDALMQCNQVMFESEAYIFFIDCHNPNAKGSEWQFQENLKLNHPKEGELILDILTDNRVGGVEFLSKLYSTF